MKLKLLLAVVVSCVALVAVACGSGSALSPVLADGAQARKTITLPADSSKKIRGDVLWMRMQGSGHELLAPFTIDYQGLWCWAPAIVFEESCTVTVGHRKNGLRNLVNGSQVGVRVTYTGRY